MSSLSVYWLQMLVMTLLMSCGTFCTCCSHILYCFKASTHLGFVFCPPFCTRDTYLPIEHASNTHSFHGQTCLLQILWPLFWMWFIHILCSFHGQIHLLQIWWLSSIVLDVSHPFLVSSYLNLYLPFLLYQNIICIAVKGGIPVIFWCSCGVSC